MPILPYTEEEFCSSIRSERSQLLIKQVAKAIKELQRDRIKAIVKENYNLGLIPGLCEIKRAEDNIKRYKANKRNNLVCWLTVNPRKSVSFKKFKSTVEGYASRVICKEVYYVYEQRGNIMEENTGKGFHCHMLILRNLTVKPSKFYKYSKNTFKNICNTTVDSAGHSAFYFRWCDTAFLVDKLAYMRGEKHDPEKADKVEGDEYFRFENLLQDTYGNIRPFEDLIPR